MFACYYVCIKCVATKFLLFLDDQHNLPCVRRCTNDIMRSVYNNKKIANEPLKSLPNLSRRFVEDTYLCIYFDPDGVMYQ